MRCKLRYEEPAGSFDPRFLFLLGCNDDGLVSYAATDLGGSVQVIDLAGNHMQVNEGSSQMVVGETYALELAFDGQQVTASLNGKARGRASTGPRTSGAVFLLTAADFGLAVDELVVEGTPTPDALGRLQAEWTRARLIELGLE